jgi:hypothetical protein
VGRLLGRHRDDRAAVRIVMGRSRPQDAACIAWKFFMIWSEVI